MRRMTLSLEGLEARDCPSLFSYGGGPVLHEPEINLFTPGATVADATVATNVAEASLKNLGNLGPAYGLEAGRLVRTFGGPALAPDLPGGAVSEKAIEAYIVTQFTGFGFFQNANAPHPLGQVQPDGLVHDQCYFVILPPGVTTDRGGSYHDDFTVDQGGVGADVPFAVITTGGTTPLSVEFSRLLDDLATDPVPTTGWFSPFLKEVADPQGPVLQYQVTDFNGHPFTMAVAEGPNGAPILPGFSSPPAPASPPAPPALTGPPVLGALARIFADVDQLRADVLTALQVGTLGAVGRVQADVGTLVRDAFLFQVSFPSD